jgi:tetratricopeptide (TPR) repeat protein
MRGLALQIAATVHHVYFRLVIIAAVQSIWLAGGCASSSLQPAGLGPQAAWGLPPASGRLMGQGPHAAGVAASAQQTFMSPAQARNEIFSTLQRAGGYGMELRQVNVDRQGFSFFIVDENNPNSSASESYRFADLGFVTDQFSLNWLSRYVHVGRDRDLYWKKPEDAKQFARAVNAIAYQLSPERLSEDEVPFEQFRSRLRAWRAQGAKPVAPDDIRRSQAVAEDAFNNKDFDKAILAYEEGLEIFPFWPDGHFNAALLCGESEMYGRAVAHAKRYLELEPDSPDAEKVRDKLYVWESKLRRP